MRKVGEILQDGLGECGVPALREFKVVAYACDAVVGILSRWIDGVRREGVDVVGGNELGVGHTVGSLLFLEREVCYCHC